MIAGVRRSLCVLDYSSVLADFGAEIIKVRKQFGLHW